MHLGSHVLYLYNLKQTLRTYQTKLTNLSAGNKSLLHLRAYKYADIDVNEFNFMSSEPSIKIVEKLLLGKSVPLCLIDDPRSEANNLVSKRVRQLQNRVKFIQNERGTEDLYLAYPFVEGKLKSGFSVRSPLIFIPVKITTAKNQWQLLPNGDAPIKFNKSFLLAYAHYHEVKLDKVLEDFEIDDLNFEDLKSFLTKLYDLLKTSSLELNFNQELFEEKLKYFHNIKKADFESEHKEGVLKLQPLAVLGIYPQAGSNLFTDYENIIENCSFDSLEDYFSTKISDNQLVREESFFTPLAIDASQEEAMKLLRSGKSIVVQGPPGTGKSQLIAQVIADYMANGKKVLLTCDKRVALDVVYNRLEAIGLEKHLALVHDHNTDRKKLFEKLSYFIENLEHTQHQNNSYDTIALERDFVQVSRRISHIEEELNTFKVALFTDDMYGVNVKYLYLNTEKFKQNILTSENEIHACKSIKENDLQAFLIKLNYWLPRAALFENDPFSLKNRKSYASFQISDKNQILQAYRIKENLGHSIFTFSQNTLNKSLSILDFEALNYTSNDLDNLLVKLDLEEIYDIFVNYLPKKLRKDRLINFIENIKIIQQNILVQTLNDVTLNHELELVNKAIELKNKTLGSILYFFKYPEKEKLNKVLLKYTFLNKIADLNQLKHKLEQTLTFLELTNNLKKGGFVVNFNNLENEHTLNDWAEDQFKVLDAVEIFKSLPQEYFKHWSELTFKEFQKTLKEFNALQYQTQSQLLQIRKYITELGITQKSVMTEIENDLNTHFDALTEFDRFTENFSEFEKIIAHAVKSVLGNPQDIIQNVKNSVYLHWISVLEELNPVLKSVSTGYVQNLEEELQNLLIRKQSLSKEIVLLKGSENAYKNLEYNRLGNRTTYRDLLHETTKKKKLLSVRQLFGIHQEEVLQIIPCWMASPETVSAIFPNKEVFDLVIFDEASQCFTEEAIPTLFRGKQILVAGDSKQLPPNDLYRARWEDEDETIDEQTHSLLDLACRYLPQTMLCEHYRSWSYDLIAFSNQKFYHNKLRLIPELSHYNQKQKALEYIRVYGVWQNQSNYLEAVECVRLVKKHLSETPTKTLGIITFNFKQQELIQDLLLEESIKEQFTLPETLFVKNIENVQGDERDIIIFSVAYAPNEDGKMVSSFGTFAMQGGENRLNVAITRAKEKMYILASILPHQLNTENSKNQGPALLKEYLQYVWDLSSETGVQSLEVQSLKFKVQSSSNSNLYSLLITQNPKLITQNQFAELLHYDNRNATTAIITDDHIFYQSRSAKEIHGYIPQTLVTKNWLVQKKYSREWWDGKG